MLDEDKQPIGDMSTQDISTQTSLSVHHTQTHHQDVFSSCVSMVTACLQCNPDSRPTATKLLEFPFFTHPIFEPNSVRLYGASSCYPADSMFGDDDGSTAMYLA
eukprot:TRINITY_DN52253_c0_g2_i2.p2 TRINITY_DN52253_c0_g2~~TRINITY_DN52253_c0_g2_i2.p2  ORF type:complete len:114 (+),score=19.73 TRINITY_DN52253_c0_g2_i2:32-343(+)